MFYGFKNQMLNTQPLIQIPNPIPLFQLRSIQKIHILKNNLLLLLLRLKLITNYNAGFKGGIKNIFQSAVMCFSVARLRGNQQVQIVLSLKANCCLQVIIIFKMPLVQKIKKVISNIDMFYSSQMLRYNQDTQYRTVTGGIVTIGITIIVVIGFFSMISETINKTAISSSVNIITSNNPPEYNLTANKQNMFMFGLQITSQDLSFFYDMNAPQRYFDITVQDYAINYGVLESITPRTMVQCTDQHWNMIPDLVNNKNLLLYNTWLCPPINDTYTIQGGFFSNIFKQTVIRVKKCTNASNPSQPCYPQSDIDQLFTNYTNFYFSINYINTVINPSQVQYLTYYIESMDDVMFSATQGSELYYLFTDYQIQTDNSYWPFQDLTVDTGSMVLTRAPSRGYSFSPNLGYVTAVIAKSSQSFQCTRTVQKISAVFSYIGGLFGAISAVLFLIKAYTDTSLQLSIALKLFKEPEQKKDNEGNQKQMKNSEEFTSKEQALSKKGFNVISYIKLTLYKLLKDFKFTQKWSQAKKLQEFQAQINNHLDIRNLLRRIINIQNCISCIFDQYQLSCLKHQQKMDIQKVKKLRKMLVEDSDSDLQQMNQDDMENVIYHFETNSKKVAKPTAQLSSFLSPERLADPNRNPSEQIQNSDIQLSLRNNNSSILGSGINNPKTRFISKKTMKCFNQLSKSKDQNLISRKIWENSNQEIKNYVMNCFQEQKSQRSANLQASNVKKRSFIKPTLPTIVVKAQI